MPPRSGAAPGSARPPRSFLKLTEHLRVALRVLDVHEPDPAIVAEVVLDVAVLPDHRLSLAAHRDARVGRLAQEPPQLLLGRPQPDWRLAHRCALSPPNSDSAIRQ